MWLAISLSLVNVVKRTNLPQGVLLAIRQYTLSSSFLGLSLVCEPYKYAALRRRNQAVSGGV